MKQLLEKLIFQVPALVIVVILVVVFLNFLSSQVKDVVTEFRKAIESTSSECHVVQKEAIRVITSCAGSVNRNSEVLIKVGESLIEMKILIRELGSNRNK